MDSNASGREASGTAVSRAANLHRLLETRDGERGVRHESSSMTDGRTTGLKEVTNLRRNGESVHRLLQQHRTNGHG